MHFIVTAVRSGTGTEGNGRARGSIKRDIPETFDEISMVRAQLP